MNIQRKLFIGDYSIFRATNIEANKLKYKIVSWTSLKL